MANELFPVALVPEFNSNPQETFKTIRTPKDAAQLSVISKWRFSKLRGTQMSFIATLAQLQTYRAFWVDVRGGGIPFDFRMPWDETLTDLYVGVGDGVTTLFSVPAYSSGVITVYVDGVTQTHSVDWADSTGTGDNGRDQIQFITVPADGALVTVDIIDCQRMLVVLGNDVHQPQEIGVDLFRLTISLDEV